MSVVRVLERTFVVYFLAYIPLILVMDLQVLLPGMYPPALSKIYTWLITAVKDPLMANPEPWFLSTLWMESIPQLVFFPIAAYAFWKGNCKWIRTPVVIYATHIITVAVACLAQVLFADYSNARFPSPKTLKERLIISSVFSLLLVIPLLMLLVVLFSPAYNQVEKKKKK